MRPSGRQADQLREISIETGFTRHAEGSVLIRFGDTHVLCTASIEAKPPPWLRKTGLGWVTAEYGMLPRATNTRNRREARNGQTGRTTEIQRLIGRALRAGTDRVVLGERQIIIDCDVLQADGGTRTAAITGGWVALHLAARKLVEAKECIENPIGEHIAAVSCGVCNGEVVLDLDYAEDSEAGTDANFVIAGSGGLVELQASAEGATFSEDEFLDMLRLARKGVGELVAIQKAALE
ncbi:MAG: ribonuclease PH [Proteobacteria bacterium]|nr:ribonuclease PH [Pseudomonadota bacterium]